jgi:NACHT domain
MPHHHVVMRRVTGVSLLLLMALAVLTLGFLLSYQGLDWADKFGSAASLVIAVIALLQPVMSRVSGWFRQSPPVSVMPMAQAQDELAAVLARQWAEEDRWRRIHDPRPLPVRYRLERSGITADYSDIVEVFRNLPERRLVILGTAGAGKSVLVVRLARGLLATRRPDEPVPLILNAATWKPEINVTDWIEAELKRGYPPLASPVPSAEGTTILTRMLADGGVLPIIDALDELPEPLRVRAIADLSAYGSDRPLVMTSRPDEYEQAIETFGRPLALTETATLSALRIEECRRYLVDATAHDTRWDGVFAELRPRGARVGVIELAHGWQLGIRRQVDRRVEANDSHVGPPKCGVACQTVRLRPRAH